MSHLGASSGDAPGTPSWHDAEVSAELLPSPAAARPADGAMELRREAYTMALYVAICLLAALAAVSEPALDTGPHVLVLPSSIEPTVVRLVLAGFIALVGYAVVRSGASDLRPMVHGIAILVVGVIVALVTNVLVGH